MFVFSGFFVRIVRDILHTLKTGLVFFEKFRKQAVFCAFSVRTAGEKNKREKSKAQAKREQKKNKTRRRKRKSMR